MTPRADIERWDELTRGKRNALVAVHVRRWHTGIVITTVGRARSIPTWFDENDNAVIPIRDYGPTTDHNDKTEAVLAFEDAEIGTVFFEGKLKRIMFGRGQNISCLGATDWMTADPDSVCRAMLEARAEREDGA